VSTGPLPLFPPRQRGQQRRRCPWACLKHAQAALMTASVRLNAHEGLADCRAKAAAGEEETPEASLEGRSEETDENDDSDSDWRAQRALLHTAVQMARVALRCAPCLLVLYVCRVKASVWGRLTVRRMLCCREAARLPHVSISLCLVPPRLAGMCCADVSVWCVNSQGEAVERRDTQRRSAHRGVRLHA